MPAPRYSAVRERDAPISDVADDRHDDRFPVAAPARRLDVRAAESSIRGDGDRAHDVAPPAVIRRRRRVPGRSAPRIEPITVGQRANRTGAERDHHVAGPARSARWPRGRRRAAARRRRRRPLATNRVGQRVERDAGNRVLARRRRCRSAPRASAPRERGAEGVHELRASA